MTIKGLKGPMAIRAYNWALRASQKSPCMRQQIGVAIFRETIGVISDGFNAPPDPYGCLRTAQCIRNCNKVCTHAEVNALLDMMDGLTDPQGCDLLSVTTVSEGPIPVGPPDCSSCSSMLLGAGIQNIWLLHEDGWCGYTAVDYHGIVLDVHGLPGRFKQ